MRSTRESADDIAVQKARQLPREPLHHTLREAVFETAADQFLNRSTDGGLAGDGVCYVARLNPLILSCERLTLLSLFFYVFRERKIQWDSNPNSRNASFAVVRSATEAFDKFNRIIVEYVCHASRLAIKVNNAVFV